MLEPVKTDAVSIRQGFASRPVFQKFRNAFVPTSMPAVPSTRHAAVLLNYRESCAG